MKLNQKKKKREKEKKFTRLRIVDQLGQLLMQKIAFVSALSLSPAAQLNSEQYIARDINSFRWPPSQIPELKTLTLQIFAFASSPPRLNYRHYTIRQMTYGWWTRLQFAAACNFPTIPRMPLCARVVTSGYSQKAAICTAVFSFSSVFQTAILPLSKKLIVPHAPVINVKPKRRIGNFEFPCSFVGPGLNQICNEIGIQTGEGDIRRRKRGIASRN